MASACCQWNGCRDSLCAPPRLDQSWHQQGFELHPIGRFLLLQATAMFTFKSKGRSRFFFILAAACLTLSDTVRTKVSSSCPTWAPMGGCCQTGQRRVQQICREKLDCCKAVTRVCGIAQASSCTRCLGVRSALSEASGTCTAGRCGSTFIARAKSYNNNIRTRWRQRAAIRIATDSPRLPTQVLCYEGERRRRHYVSRSNI